MHACVYICIYYVTVAFLRVVAYDGSSLCTKKKVYEIIIRGCVI